MALTVPNVVFKTRVRDESLGGDNPFRWQDVSTDDVFKGKKVVIFGLPGAFTPTCSAKHVPGYVEHFDAIKAKGVDEIWCISVNDPFVMGAWGRDLKVGKKIRMLGDGSAEFTKKMGIELDLTARGLGVRSDRYAMIVEDGVVKTLDREAPGKFEVSDAASILKKL